MASIAAGGATEAAAVVDDTRVPDTDAEHGHFNPRNIRASERGEMPGKDTDGPVSTSLSRRVSRRLSIRRSRRSSVDRASEVLDQEGQNSDYTTAEPTKRHEMQEYLSKLQELHAGGLLTEHQRKKFKEGVLLKANGVKEQINEKYELLEKFRNVTIDVIRKSGMKEGYLMKTAQTNKDTKSGIGSYKKRYFCLRPMEHKLVYFTTKELSKVDPTSLEYEALGEIDLSIGKRVAHIVTDVNKPRSCKIVCGNVSVMLKAKDEQEMTEWIEAFAEAKAATFYKKDGKKLRRDISNYSYCARPGTKTLSTSAACKAGEDGEDQGYGLLQCVQMKGVLVKRGENVRNWKARYFVLEDDRIEYFEGEENSTSAKPLGVIKFADIDSEDMVSLSCIKRFAFKIITMNRTYFFMARSIEESRSWQNAIFNNIRLYRQHLRTAEMVAQSMSGKEKILQGLKEQSLDRARQLFNQEHQARSKMNKVSSNSGVSKSKSARGSIHLRSGSLREMRSSRSSYSFNDFLFKDDITNPDAAEQQEIKNAQRYAKITKNGDLSILSPDEVPNFNVWNHRENIEYLASKSQYTNFHGDNSKEMWGQFEFFISTNDIVIGEDVYKMLNAKGNSIFSAMKRQFSTKREDLHAVMPSMGKYFMDSGSDALTMGNNLSDISMYAVVWMSQPTIEAKEYLREKSYEGKVLYTKICRTETVEGTGDAKFSVATLLSLPLNLSAVPREFLFWNTEDERDTTTTEGRFEAIIRVEVFLNVGSNDNCLFGASEFYLSEVMDALKHNVKVSHMMATSNDIVEAVAGTKNKKHISVVEAGYQPRISLTPFWPKFYSKIVQPLRAVMAQTYRFSLPSSTKHEMYLDSSLAKKRGSVVVGRYDQTDIYAREEVIEAILTFDIPSAWARLKAEEWNEEHRRLGNFLGLYTQKSHEEFRKKGIKQMEEQRKREEDNFKGALQGLGLMGPALENKPNTDEEDGNEDLGRSLSSVIKSSKSNEWRFRMLQSISDVIDEYTHLADIYTVFTRTVEQCTSRHGGALTFKSSKKKKHRDFCFVATNLHTQFFSISTSNHNGRHQHIDNSGNSTNDELVYTHDFITTGAPAAHHLGFEKGGLCSKRDELEEVISYLQYMKDDEMGVRDRAFSAVTQASDEIKLINELTACHYEGFADEEDSKALTIDFLTKRIAKKNHEARLREDIVVSQAMSGLCESFRLKLFLYAERLQNVANNSQDANDMDWRWYNMFDIYTECGFLYQLESLLSTSDKELGMLQDAYGGIRALRFCHLTVGKEGESPYKQDVVHAGAEDGDSARLMMSTHGTIPIDNSDINDLRFMDSKSRTVRSGVFEITRLSIFDEEHAGELLIKLYVPAKVFDVLPKNIQRGQRIAVKPLMFTQGVNEKQALANASYLLGIGKNLGLQSNINDSSLRHLRSYFKVFERCAIKLNINRNDRQSARNKLNALEYEVQTAKINQKTWQILSKSANIVRFLGGGRATCCKSAKDRTSMSVTYEEARICMGLSEKDLEYQLSMANVMREFGVRIGNARKNIGKKRFAFNTLQRRMLPEVYKPPTAVAGNAVS